MASSEGAASASPLEFVARLIFVSPDGAHSCAHTAVFVTGDQVALTRSHDFDPTTRGHDAGTALHCTSWQGSPTTVAAILATPAGRAMIDMREPRRDSIALG